MHNAISSSSFDEAEEIMDEVELVQGLQACNGVAVADAFAPAWGGRNRPVQVKITNYRLFLFQPAPTGATLHVTLCSGHGLKPCDKNGFSDPYALLSLTGHRTQQVPKKTSVKLKTLDPVWNETFVFENVDRDASLTIALYDEDKYSQHDFMGEAFVQDVAQCQHQFSERVPIFEGISKRGILRLRISCVQPQPESASRHCSIPLLCIEDVRLACNNSIEVWTKLADYVILRFDDARMAASVFKELSESPRQVGRSLFLSANSSTTEEESPHDSLAPPCRRYSFDLPTELRRWAGAGEGTGTTHKAEVRWRVDSELNAEYGLCPTYPKAVVLPAALSPEEVQAGAKFRTKDRFPYVAWLHSGNGAALVRCSQPRTKLGMGMSAAAAEDCSRLMKFVSDGCDELTICDARPFANAEANALAGGGTEYNANSQYEGCHFEFLGIDNIHEMEKSLVGFRRFTSQQDDQPACSAALAAWQGHLNAVIKGASFVASVLESGESVVVHCSDGWDRTSQIVSLASLLLDGHYRTVRGLADLIQKDWLLPGHKFACRHGLRARSHQRAHAGDLSPIFLQFLDCAAQVWTVYPQFFQYSIKLLSFVLYHSYSGRYRNFFGNCEREREGLQARRGPCLWTEVLQDSERWRNPLYDPATALMPIVPCVVPIRRLAFCAELYSSLSGFFTQDVGCMHVLEDATFSPRSSPHSGQESLVRTRTRSCEQDSPWSPADARYVFCSAAALATGDCPEMSPPSDKCMIVERALRRFLGVDASFPQGPTVSVASYAEHADHAEFVITVAAGDKRSEVRRRFSEFDKLSHDLQAARLVCSEPFPRKTFRRCQGDKKLEERRRQLDAWLQSVLAEARAMQASPTGDACGEFR